MSTHQQPRIGCNLVALLALTLLYYGGGATFAYASQPGIAESSPAGPIAGTGSIQGEVVDSVTGAPVARARVGLSRMAREVTELQSLEITTDEAGKFVVARVPAGEYTWWVRKSGYMTGGGRPTLRGMANGRLQVAASQVLRLRMPVAPAALLLGRVLAPDGEPIEDAAITLFHLPSPGARPRRVDLSSIATNDVGEFRIPRLTLGSYLVMAHTRQFSAWGDGGQLVSTWYPGTASAAGAMAIEVAQGAVVSGIDITLQDVKPVTVTGTVLDRAGRPVTSGEVAVFIEREGTRIPVGPAAGSRRSIEGDGTYQLRLPPGEYWITASTEGSGGIGSISLPMGMAQPSPEQMEAILAKVRREMLEKSGSASMKVSVGNAPIDGLTLQLQPPLVMKGRVIFEGRQAPPDALTFVNVDFTSADESGDCKASGGPDLESAPDGTFEIFTSPGTCVPVVTTMPGWYVKAIYLGGTDVTLRSVTFEPGQSPGEMRVILTDRRNELSFAVVDGRGAATKEYVALVFPADESLWGLSLERQMLRQTLRLHVPRGDGAASAPDMFVPQGPHSDYSVPLDRLVPGEYYAIAVDDASWEVLADPAMLRRLAGKATKFTISEGEKRRLDLKRFELASF